MPTLALFITLAVTLAVVLAAIVLMPWLHSNNSRNNKLDELNTNKLNGNRTTKHNQLIALNVEVFKSRLEELQADYQNRRIGETEYAAQKLELERQLLQASKDSEQNPQDDTAMGGAATKSKQPQRSYQSQGMTARVTLLIWIPLLMGLGYVLVSDRTPIRTLWQAQDNVGQVADDLLTGAIDTPPEWATKDSVGLLSAIQTNVHRHAHDPMRWMHLAEVFLMLEANDQGIEALQRAYRLDPTDPTVAVRYAQTAFFSNNGSLDDESRSALQNVLSQYPDHQGAQMLMAMGEARAGNYELAQGWIDKLRDSIAAKDGDHSPALKSLDELSANIDKQMAQQAEAAAINSPQPAQPIQAATTSSPSIEIVITANPSIQPLIEVGDTLFVTIKADSGGAPVAVKRLDAAQLLTAANGVKVKLSDQDAMMPTHTLSSALAADTKLVATARVSKSGQAMAQTGDLSAVTVPVDVELANKKDVNEKQSSSNSTIRTLTMEINQQL